MLLIAITWAGFVACVRALAGDATSLTTGLAAAGMTAASVLVSLDLYERVAGIGRHDRDAIGPAVVLLVLAAPVLILLVPAALE